MGRWYLGVPKNMTMETTSNIVPKEVARYVAAHRKPDRRPDQTHQDLHARLGNNPCDVAALKQWGEHMQRKRHTEVTKKLRRFRKSVIGSIGTFFADLAAWLVKPAHVSSMSPALASAQKAARFCGGSTMGSGEGLQYFAKSPRARNSRGSNPTNVARVPGGGQSAQEKVDGNGWGSAPHNTVAARERAMDPI